MRSRQRSFIFLAVKSVHTPKLTHAHIFLFWRRYHRMFSLKFHHLSLFIWFYHHSTNQHGLFYVCIFHMPTTESIQNVFFVDKLPFYFCFWLLSLVHSICSLFSCFLLFAFCSVMKMSKKFHRTWIFTRFNFVPIKCLWIFFSLLMMSFNSFDSFML